MWRRAVTAALAVALLTAAAALADPLDPQTKINAADQAAAKAALLTRADLGSGWSGGEMTPTSLKSPRCPTLQPSFHDLTLTGHAEASFRLGTSGWQIDTDVTILKTKKQVAAQYQRLMKPALAGCVRYDLLKTTGADPNATLGPGEKVNFPKLATVALMFRVPIGYKVGKQTINFVDDTIFLSKGRTQFWLNFLAPASDSATLELREQEIAKTLLNRVRV